jgi:lambda family phage portal protein
MGFRIIPALKRSLFTFAQYIGAYASTDTKRKGAFEGWKPARATANQAMIGTLSTLVAQSRHLERTTTLGRSVVEAWKADVVGSGIDILPTTGDVNLDLELLEAWHDYADSACVDGTPLWEWQAQVVGDMVTAGSSLDRLVLDPERISQGRLPLAILPLEVEWLSEIPVGLIPDGMMFVRGVVVDKWGRPAFYHLRNPDTYQFWKGEIVPAADIIHCYEKRRKQQNHGEPVLAPAVERILQDDRLVRSELQSAVNASAPAAVITSAIHPDNRDDDGDPVTDIPTGSVVRLLPGEELSSFAPERPNSNIPPFRATIRGDVAGATRCSQFWLDRDCGRANYSSMRMDQLLTKRSLAPVKSLVGRQAAGRVYEAIFPWLMLRIGRPLPSDPVQLARLKRYEIRPDQPEYVDPVKDVGASETAIAANLSTYEIECSSRGKDYVQVIQQRGRENALLVANGLPLPQPKNAAGAQPTELDPEAQDAIDKQEAVNA